MNARLERTHFPSFSVINSAVTSLVWYVAPYYCNHRYINDINLAQKVQLFLPRTINGNVVSFVISKELCDHAIKCTKRSIFVDSVLSNWIVFALIMAVLLIASESKMGIVQEYDLLAKFWYSTSRSSTLLTNSRPFLWSPGFNSCISTNLYGPRPKFHQNISRVDSLSMTNSPNRCRIVFFTSLQFRSGWWLNIQNSVLTLKLFHSSMKCLHREAMMAIHVTMIFTLCICNWAEILVIFFFVEREM